MSIFKPMTARVRKDQLGIGTLAELENNIYANAFDAKVEHTGAGLHNATEIAKAIGTVTVAGGPTYSLSPSTLGEGGFGSLAGGHNPAVGTVIVTLSSGKFTANMAAVASCTHENGANVPTICGVRPTSATTCEFYCKYLTSALGAGNTWAAIDGPFDLAIFDFAYVSPGYGITGTNPLAKNNGLRLGTWNADVADINTLFSNLSVGHNTSTGVHTVYEIPTNQALIQWDGATTYAKVDSKFKIRDFGTITRVSQGIVELSLVTGSWTTPIAVFCEPDYARIGGGASSDVFQVVTTQAGKTASKVTVYIYKYSAGVWNRADTDFHIAIHSSGAP